MPQGIPVRMDGWEWLDESILLFHGSSGVTAGTLPAPSRDGKSHSWDLSPQCRVIPVSSPRLLPSFPGKLSQENHGCPKLPGSAPRPLFHGNRASMGFPLLPGLLFHGNEASAGFPPFPGPLFRGFMDFWISAPTTAGFGLQPWPGQMELGAAWDVGNGLADASIPTLTIL